MKKIFIILAALTLVCMAFFVVYRMSNPPASNTEISGNDPFENLTDSGMLSGGRQLYLTDGSQVPVPDFLLSEQPEWASSEYGYQVTSNEQETYSIIFYPSDSGFLISVFSEPLGSVRREAESILRSKLQLSNEQLCKLNAQVFTQVSVNESYAGQNLGLSFCPGSVQLPG